jgi:glycosyltransferase involved in cell wall biosynthesis
VPSRRLGINLVFLNPERTGGAETYTRALLQQFHRLELNVDGPVHLFVGRGHQLKVDPDRFRLVECDIDPRHQYRRIIWEQTHLPAILRRYELDLVHFPYSAYPIRYGGRCVVSVHDTTRFVAPRGVPRAQIYYRQVMEARLARNGHHVIAVSRADADILRKELSLADAQLSVIHHGVSDAFRTGEPFDGPRPYLLWAGRPYEHKRIDTLLDAYATLAKRAVPNLPPLRLIGIPAADRGALERRCRSANVSFEPPLPHADLPDLFRRAAVFLFPSSYESFGLPAAEAMAAGTPVICSDIPAFRELFSPAARLFPAGNAEALAAALESLLSDPDRRRAMQLAGIRHAARFTWEQCARQTLDVFRRLMR